MMAKHIVRFVCGLFLIALMNGCVTKGLWENGNLEAWNQPAANPNLRLFEAKPTGNLLVVYDEYSERRNSIHTRAFWLNENQKPLAEHYMPHFVSASSTPGLISIPVFFAHTNQSCLPPPPYAIVATNGQSLIFHLRDGLVSSYDLPFYNDGKGKVEKFILTPVAVTADATIVGSILGLLYLEARYNVPLYPVPDN
jgi:hypothetical protein